MILRRRSEEHQRCTYISKERAREEAEKTRLDRSVFKSQE